MLKAAITALIIALAPLAAAVGNEEDWEPNTPLTPDEQKIFDELYHEYKLLECRGKFPRIVLSGTALERKILARILELRRRGDLPPYDLQFCIKNEILPFREAPKHDS